MGPARQTRSLPSAARVHGTRSFAVALIVSALLHLILIVAGAGEPAESPERTEKALEVLILRHPEPSEPPDEPKALAQADQRGAGADEGTLSVAPDEEADPQRDAPELAQRVDELPSLAETDPAPPADPQPLPQREPLSLQPLTSVDDSQRAESVRAPVDAGQILLSRNAEIARLSEQVRERSAAYASRPRRRAISASTREYKYASYLEAWRRKVERIGNINYPEVAKQRNLYGSLILHVAVRADGRVEKIRVLRSSGYPELDDAAVRIVELAAPFSPFPPDIRAEADVLDITRTWQFLHGNRLGWED